MSAPAHGTLIYDSANYDMKQLQAPAFLDSMSWSSQPTRLESAIQNFQWACYHQKPETQRKIDIRRDFCISVKYIQYFYIIVKLRLGSGTQAQSGSDSGSVTQAQ